MAKITLEVPDELRDQLAQLGDRLPELLALSLQQPPLPVHIYQYILGFLASLPTTEMQTRLQTLLQISKARELTSREQRELDEYERIEHLIVMLKAGSLPHITNKA